MTLENTGQVPTMVQVETFAWNGSVDVEALEPTRGLLAVPAVFNLDAGGRQVIRVARRDATVPDVETAYRLLITEVPTADADTAAGVRFALRLSLPVFVTPPGAVAVPDWALHRSTANRTLEVVNRGNAHLHVRQLTVRDRASGRIVAKFDQPSYILASNRHSWADLVPGSAGPVIVEAATNLGDLILDLGQ